MAVMEDMVMAVMEDMVMADMEDLVMADMEDLVMADMEDLVMADMEDLVMADMVMVVMDMVVMEDMAMEDTVIAMEDTAIVMVVLDMGAITKTMAAVIHKAIHSLQHITRAILSNLHTKPNRKCILNLKHTKLHRRTFKLSHTKTHILKIHTKLQHIQKIIMLILKRIIHLTNKLLMWMLRILVLLPIMAINSCIKIQPTLSKLANINKLAKILLKLQTLVKYKLHELVYHIMYL